jgi:osmotically-inducible protein OsmY
LSPKTEAGRAASPFTHQEETVMAQNYRNQSDRPGQSRGGGYSGGSDRSAYRSSGDYASDSNRNDRSRGPEGERHRYSEQFGYRGETNRDDNSDFNARNVDRSDNQDQGYGGRDERDSRLRDWGRFDESDRWSPQSGGGGGYGAGGAEDFFERSRGTSTSRWHEDQGDGGGYFNTGSYIDDGARSLSNDFYRARAQQERDFGSYRDRDRGTSGDGGRYGKSYYGSQSNYGRGHADDSRNQPWQGQRGSSYENRSSWDYGQGAGSGSSGGAYGRDPQLSGQNYGSFGGSQSFRGRGPRGYQRSDERLKEMICERLTDDPAIDASNISIEVSGRVVKLTGTVEDRSTKYEVEELVEQMGGVEDIDNQLRVQSSRWGSQQSAFTGGQQARGGGDREAGSSSVNASGSTSSRSSAGTSSGASTTGSPNAGGASKRN